MSLAPHWQSPKTGLLHAVTTTELATHFKTLLGGHKRTKRKEWAALSIFIGDFSLILPF